MKNQNVNRRHKQITEKYEKGIEKLLSRRKNAPDYYYKKNEEENDIDSYIFSKMTNPLNYLKNPRYEKTKKTIKYKETLKKPENSQKLKNTFFRADPEILNFHHFQINKKYTKKVFIINSDTCLRRLKFLPPKTEFFKIVSIKYPLKNSTEIASGNCVEFQIEFSGNRKKDYKDCLTIITEKDYFFYLLKAEIEKPKIIFKKEFFCGKCWLGDFSKKFIRFKNFGGFGKFEIFFENEEKNFRFEKNIFEIGKNEVFETYVFFEPGNKGVFKQEFFIRNEEDYVVKGSLVGESYIVDLRQVVSENKFENMTENLKKKEFVENDLKNEKNDLFKEFMKKNDIINKTDILKNTKNLVEKDSSKIRTRKIYFKNCETFGIYEKELKFKNFTNKKIKFNWDFVWKQEKKIIHSLSIKREKQKNSQFLSKSKKLYKNKSLSLKIEKNKLKKFLSINENFEKIPNHKNFFLEQINEVNENFEINTKENFSITPESGIFEPFETKIFILKFSSFEKPKNYSIQMQQLIYDIPKKALQIYNKNLADNLGILNFKYFLKSEVIFKKFDIFPKKIFCEKKFLVKRKINFFLEIDIGCENYDYLYVNPHFVDIDADVWIESLERIRCSGENLENEDLNISEKNLKNNSISILEEKKNKDLKNILGKKKSKDDLKNVNNNENDFDKSNLSLKLLEKEKLVIQYNKKNLEDFKVNPGEKWKIKFIVRSLKKGHKKFQFLIKLKNSLSKKFEIEADFKGPKIKINQKFIKTSNLPINSETYFNLKIKNLSKISEKIFLMNNLEKVNSLEIFKNFGNKVFENKNNSENFIIKNSFLEILPENEVFFEFLIKASKAQKIEKNLKLYSENNGFLDNIKIESDFKNPFIDMNHKNLVFENLFVEKKYLYKNFEEEKYLKLFNPNDFDIKWSFDFTNFENEKNIFLKFEPFEGILKSKEIADIKYKFLLKKIGDLIFDIKIKFSPFFENTENQNNIKNEEELFIINNKKQNKKIRISINKNNRNSILEKEIKVLKNSENEKTKNFFFGEYNFFLKFKNIKGIEINFLQKDKKIQNLEFEGNLMEAIVHNFTLENTSDLKVPFNLKLKKIFFKKINSEILFENKENKSNNNLLINSKSTNLSIYSQAVYKEINDFPEFHKKSNFNFKSQNGILFQKKNFFSVECLKLIKKNKKETIGVFSENSGILLPKSKKRITFIIFGINPVFLEDELILESSKFEKKILNFKINLNGLKFKLLDSQVGLEKVDNLVSLLDFGEIICWRNSEKKIIKLMNKSDKTLTVYLGLYDTFPENENLEIVNEKKNLENKNLEIENEKKNLENENNKNDCENENKNSDLKKKVKKVDLKNTNKSFNFENEEKNLDFRIDDFSETEYKEKLKKNVFKNCFNPPKKTFSSNHLKLNKIVIKRQTSAFGSKKKKISPEKNSKNFFNLNFTFTKENKLKINWDFNLKKIVEKNKKKTGFFLNSKKIIIPPNSIYPLKIDYIPYKKFPVKIEKEEKVLILSEIPLKKKNKNYIAIKLKAKRVLPSVKIHCEPFLKGNNPLFTFYKFPICKKKSFLSCENPLFIDFKSICVENKSKSCIGFLGILNGPFFFENKEKKRFFEIKRNAKIYVKVFLEDFDFMDFKKWPLTKKNFMYGNLILDYESYYYEEIKNNLPKIKMRNTIESFFDASEKKENSQNSNFCENRQITNKNILQIKKEFNFKKKKIDLEAILLRPKLYIIQNLSKPFKSSKKPLTINFQNTHIKNKKIKKIYIINNSPIRTKFKIIHKPFFQKKPQGFATKTKNEIENLEAFDKPENFIFEKNEGILENDATFLNIIPESNFVVKGGEIIGNRAFLIKIMFLPKENLFYKSAFKVLDVFGGCCEFVLKGVGSVREEDFKETL